jgi:homoserine dehydrogenase
MQSEGGEFADILADAQKLGYAEADPTADVDGLDAADKIAILASLGLCGTN